MCELNQIPEIMTVKDIKSLLNIGWNEAYSLCKRKDFPVIKIGRIYRIPKFAFLRWLEKQTTI